MRQAQRIAPGGVLVVENEFSTVTKGVYEHGHHDELSRARRDTTETAASSGSV